MTVNTPRLTRLFGRLLARSGRGLRTPVPTGPFARAELALDVIRNTEGGMVVSGTADTRCHTARGRRVLHRIYDRQGREEQLVDGTVDQVYGRRVELRFPGVRVESVAAHLIRTRDHFVVMLEVA